MPLFGVSKRWGVVEIGQKVRQDWIMRRKGARCCGVIRTKRGDRINEVDAQEKNTTTREVCIR